MVIKQVSLGTGLIEVSSDDNLGLALESNINFSNKFNAMVAWRMKKIHRIIQVGKSVSKKLFSINRKMVQ